MLDDSEGKGGKRGERRTDSFGDITVPFASLTTNWNVTREFSVTSAPEPIPLSVTLAWYCDPVWSGDRHQAHRHGVIVQRTYSWRLRLWSFGGPYEGWEGDVYWRQDGGLEPSWSERADRVQGAGREILC